MYHNQKSWKELQKLMPLKNRIDHSTEPEESYRTISGMDVHLDVYHRKSDITIVILHGVGGNGRLLSFFAVPLARDGYHVICPDLPGYGYSKFSKKVTYEDWIDVGDEIVKTEMARGKKVFLIGLSAGGMLAYNIACRNQSISGLIYTNILDNREEAVRVHSAKNRIQGKYGTKLLNLMPEFLRSIKVPIRMVTNMDALVNDTEILRVLLKDQVGAGSSVSIGFLLSMINSVPILEPEVFSKVPVLMVHPGNDRWTPVEISEIFYDRIASEKQKKILDRAGHFPVEEPGLSQMENAIDRFIQEHLST